MINVYEREYIEEKKVSHWVISWNFFRSCAFIALPFSLIFWGLIYVGISKTLDLKEQRFASKTNSRTHTVITKSAIGAKVKKMNMNDLAKEIAKKEVGKQEVSIAQIKEILKVVNTIVYSNPEVISLMIKNGKKHSEKMGSQFKAPAGVGKLKTR